MGSIFREIRGVMSHFWQKLRRRSPFLILGVLFLLSMVVPGEFSIWNQVKYSREIAKQKREMHQLTKNIKKAQVAQKELKVESDRLEKFARERYLMKEEDEDIYLLDE